MRSITLSVFVLLAAALLPSAAQAADRTPPKVYIKDVVKKRLHGGLTFFNFTIKATDNVKVRKLQYYVAVDGDSSGWTDFPYYEGFPMEIPFTVDCDRFLFEVRAIDTSRNRSTIARRSYDNLR